MSKENYWLYGMVGVVILLIFVFAIYWIKKVFSVRQKKYKRREFLTKNEKDCFNYLKKIFPEYHICPQVSMGAVLEPVITTKNPSSKERSEYTVLRNKIQCKVIDFAMLNENLMVEFLIELDDRSHDNKQEQDRLRDLNMLDANIPTVRFRRVNGSFISRNEILKQLKSKKN